MEIHLLDRNPFLTVNFYIELCIRIHQRQWIFKIFKPSRKKMGFYRSGNRKWHFWIYVDFYKISRFCWSKTHLIRNLQARNKAFHCTYEVLIYSFQRMRMRLTQNLARLAQHEEIISLMKESRSSPNVGSVTGRWGNSRKIRVKLFVKMSLMDLLWASVAFYLWPSALQQFFELNFGSLLNEAYIHL